MAFRIIGIDHGTKESLVKECGAEVFIDVTKFDDKTIAEEVKKVTGGESAVTTKEFSAIALAQVTDFTRTRSFSCRCMHSFEQGVCTSTGLLEIWRDPGLCGHARGRLRANCEVIPSCNGRNGTEYQGKRRG